MTPRTSRVRPRGTAGQLARRGRVQPGRHPSERPAVRRAAAARADTRHVARTPSRASFRRAVTTLDRRQGDAEVDQRPAEERRHRADACRCQVDPVLLEPVGMAARVEVPVDDPQLGMPFRGRPDRLVHRQVGVPRGPECGPEHPRDPGAVERLASADSMSLCVLVLEVVVAHRDDFTLAFPAPRPAVPHQLEDARRPDSVLVDRATRQLEAATGRDLELEVDPATEDADGVGIVSERLGDPARRSA